MRRKPPFIKNDTCKGNRTLKNTWYRRPSWHDLMRSSLRHLNADEAYAAWRGKSIRELITEQTAMIHSTMNPMIQDFSIVDDR